jgi:hypothetical protein
MRLHKHPQTLKVAYRRKDRVIDHAIVQHINRVAPIRIGDVKWSHFVLSK